MKRYGDAYLFKKAFCRSPEWEALIEFVKRRDGMCCQHPDCDFQSFDGKGLTAHHLVPFECIELRMDPQNLKTLCIPCHKWTHSKKNKNRIFILTYEEFKESQK